MSGVDSDLSPEELNLLTDLLSRLKPGFLPLEVFLQIARLTVLSIIELVPLRLNEVGKLEVLLLDRGPNDKFWPNEVHTPGTVIRPTDIEGGIEIALQRVIADELRSTDLTAPVYVDEILQASKRGGEYAQVYFAEVKSEPKAGTFYDYDNLPDNLMQSQREFIHQAVTAFKRAKQIQ